MGSVTDTRSLGKIRWDTIQSIAKIDRITKELEDDRRIRKLAKAIAEGMKGEDRGVEFRGRAPV